VRTGQDFYTCFLDGEVSGWTTKQRCLFFGAACEIGANWKPYEFEAPRVREMMFNGPERTIFAGGIGQINGAWGVGHLELKDALLDALAQTESATLPLATVAGNVARRVGISNPSYAAGITCFGALVLAGPVPSISAADETPAAGPGVSLELGRLADRSLDLRFFLPESGMVDLSIFDVQGRMVAPVARGPFSAGTHEVCWDGRDRVRGIYFARLVHRGQSRAELTRKIVVF
jgi:hypothetical protein